MRRIETLDDIAEGLAQLPQIDPRLEAVIARAGPVPLRRDKPGYAGIAAIIVSQMVSKASAAAIWSRIEERAGGAVTAAAFLSFSDADCRAIGLSRGKEAALRTAAAAVADGSLDLDALCAWPAGEAIAELTRLKGIGPWTAEVYLLFCAGHPDVFPSGDIALQAAAAHALSLDGRPSPRDLARIAAGWSPWRGVAARLLWAYYASEMRRDVTPLSG